MPSHVSPGRLPAGSRAALPSHHTRGALRKPCPAALGAGHRALPRGDEAEPGSAALLNPARAVAAPGALIPAQG